MLSRIKFLPISSLIIIPPFPPKIGQGTTDLKFSRSRISSSKERKKERERIRYKKRHLAFPGNGRRLDRAPYSFLSSMNYHNIICRREHARTSSPPPPPGVWPGNYISGTRDRMSTSRCNVRVIANGTTSGPGGRGREGRGRAKTGTTIGTMPGVRHRERPGWCVATDRKENTTITGGTYLR